MNNITTGLTVCTWAYQTTQSSLQMFASRQTGTVRNFEWWALTLQNNIPRALIGDNSTVTNVVGSTALTLNTWYHLAMTWNGSTITLYQDLVSIGTGTRALTMAADTTEIIINANANAAGPSNIVEFFLGRMEDLRVYSRALSINELTTIYNCKGSDSIVDGLLGRWVMDGQTGQSLSGGTVVDSGPYGLNAAVTGSPSYADGRLTGTKLNQL